MTEIKNSFLAGLAFGLILTLMYSFRVDFEYALIIGSLSGLVFGLAIYFFVTSRIVKKQTSINSEEKELIFSGGANHYLNGEAVGGKLYLLSDRLEFKSHKFNLQNHQLQIDICDIAEIKFYNSLWFIPNGLEILKTDGKKEYFVVSKRDKWKTNIEEIKRNL